MAQYRKKAVMDEATQFDGVNPVPGMLQTPNGVWYVVTIHLENARVDPGDWVITEPDGVHHYPCQDSIFRNNHEGVP